MILADGPYRHFGTWTAGRPVRTRPWAGTVAAWSRSFVDR